MPYCLNPDCPYRERVGKPAEFVEGIELCSDCGSPLSEDLPPTEKPEAEEAKKFTFTDWHKRILFTLGVLLVYRVLVHMPAPFIDYIAFDSFMDSRGGAILDLFGFPLISLMSLGIFPYLTAYILVEIISLHLPPLKKWRESGYVGRRKLRKVALITTALIAFLQSYGIAAGIEGMADGLIVANPGLGYRLMLSLTFTAGTLLSIWLADMITSWGIGHGISIIIFAGLAGRFIYGIVRIILFKHEHEFPILLLVPIVLLLIVFIVIAEKTYKKVIVKYDDGSEAHMPLKLTTAGIVPSWLAASIIGSLALIASFTGSTAMQGVADAINPGGIGYSIVYSLMIIFLYYLFTAFFYNPEKIADFLRGRNAFISVTPSRSKEDYMDRKLEIMAFIGALYLCLIAVSPDIFRFWFGLPVYLGGAFLIKTITIALDLNEEVRARRKRGNLVKIAEVHDVPMAGLAKSLLEGKGLSCHLRGYYHRALLYFFGPYIEISVLVPEEQVSEAQEVIGKYVGPEFLVQQEVRIKP